MKSGQHSYIGTLQALCKRCDIDHASGCWLWLGAMRTMRNGIGTPCIYTWCYERDEKRQQTGSRASWSLLHKRAPSPGLIVYRACLNVACVSPRHMVEGSPADMGAYIKARGDRKGTAVQTRRDNLRLAWAALGIVPTSPEIVAAIRAADLSVTGKALALLHGVSRTVVSRVRRGESHKEMRT